MDDLERFLEHILNASQDVNLTEFEKAVLKKAMGIPIGKTMTYSELAKAIGKPKSARAVGNALNKNPFPIFVPCHRIVSKKDIGGFSKGVKAKQMLLDIEQKIKEILWG